MPPSFCPLSTKPQEFYPGAFKIQKGKKRQVFDVPEQRCSMDKKGA